MNVENLIWIEPNIKENPEYLNRLKSNLTINNLITSEDVEKGIEQIIEIKFEELFVVINGELIDEFFAELNNSINKLNVIVNVIIFTNETRKKEILDNKSKYENFPFFDFDFVFVKIEDVIKKLLQMILKSIFQMIQSFLLNLLKMKNKC